MFVFKADVWKLSLIVIYLTDFYTAVNNHWTLKAQDLRNLTTLSVAGGFRDYQVRSGLAFLPRLSQHDSALSVVVKKQQQQQKTNFFCFCMELC